MAPRVISEVDTYASVFLKGPSLAAELLSLPAGQAESAPKANAPGTDLQRREIVLGK